jgi:hypothetical protein
MKVAQPIINIFDGILTYPSESRYYVNCWRDAVPPCRVENTITMARQNNNPNQAGRVCVQPKLLP